MFLGRVAAQRGDATTCFDRITGRVGQDVLLDLRCRLFDHFQRLDQLPRALHVGPGHLAADVRRRGHRRAAQLRAADAGLVACCRSSASSSLLLLLDLPLALVALARVPVRVRPARLVPASTRRGPTGPRARRSRWSSSTSSSRSAASAPCRPSGASRATRRSSRTSTTATATPTSGRPGSSPSTGPGTRLVGGISVAAVLLHRRLPGARRRHDRRRAGRLPALPAPVLRADAGAEPVLQPLPGGGRRAREAVGRARRAAGGARARAARRRSPTPRARCASTASPSATARARRSCRDLDLAIPAGQTVALVGRDRRRQDHRRPAHRPLLRPDRRPGPARRRRPARPRRRRPAPRRRHGHPGELPVLRLGRRQHRLRPPRRDARPRSRPRPGPSAPTSSSPPCPTATTPTSASGAAGCRPASASWCASPAPSSPTRTC